MSGFFYVCAALNNAFRQKKSFASEAFKDYPELIRSLDIGSLLAFRALRDFELYFLAFFERFEPIHLDS